MTLVYEWFFGSCSPPPPRGAPPPPPSRSRPSPLPPGPSSSLDEPKDSRLGLRRPIRDRQIVALFLPALPYAEPPLAPFPDMPHLLYKTTSRASSVGPTEPDPPPAYERIERRATRRNGSNRTQSSETTTLTTTSQVTAERRPRVRLKRSHQVLKYVLCGAFCAPTLPS
ncbi:hypothetical protein JCM10212_003581 [Sporobolomyces blumeae]